MLATHKSFVRLLRIGFGLFVVFGLASANASSLEDVTVPTSDCLWPGHVSFELGYKRSYLGEGDANGLIGAGPVDQFAFAGLDFDIRRANWPISLALQTQFAGGGGKYTAEAGAGLRKIWQFSQFEPFIGAGFTAASIGDVFNDSGTGYGGYGEAGAYWNFNKHWHVGLRMGYSYAPVDYTAIDIFDSSIRETRRLNAGGFQALMMFGFHW
jgi:hypothetical protein